MYVIVSDPHIKVIGLPEEVRVAKDLIMAVLDTKVGAETAKSKTQVVLGHAPLWQSTRWYHSLSPLTIMSGTDRE